MRRTGTGLCQSQWTGKGFSEDRAHDSKGTNETVHKVPKICLCDIVDDDQNTETGLSVYERRQMISVVLGGGSRDYIT